MKFRLVWVLVIGAAAFCPAAVSASGPQSGSADAPKHFHGFYAGAEVSRLNIIGGSLLDGVDNLQQESRFGATLFGGARYQLRNGLVLSFEAGAGVEDGNLDLAQPLIRLAVSYRNRQHYRLGGTVGLATGPGRRLLLFGYMSELKRTFDVRVMSGTLSLTQRDAQGLLRYGGGIEYALVGPLSVRGSVGSSRAGFGNRPTNITPAKPIDVAGGLLFRF